MSTFIISKVEAGIIKDAVSCDFNPLFMIEQLKAENDRLLSGLAKINTAWGYLRLKNPQIDFKNWAPVRDIDEVLQNETKRTMQKM